MKTKTAEKFYTYWHKGMNSGLWSADTKERAFETAKMLSKQKDVYRVVVIDLNANTETIFKGTD